MFENDDIEAHESAFGKISGDKKEKKFSPWHKPRKQWVRDKQWWGCLNNLLVNNSNIYSTENIIRYFGLPGGELLDVDFLSKKMKESEAVGHKKLLIHGLVVSVEDKNDAESRLTELLDRDNVDAQSKVERCNFNTLESHRSVLWDSVKKYAPYHFVNLDFCDNVLENKTINAIHNLLTYQFQTLVDRPWLFCLTTKIDSNGLDEELLDRLNECLQKIVDQELEISNLNEQFEPVFNAVVAKSNIKNHRENNGEFVDMFVVGFVVWLILMSVRNGVKFKLRSSVKYRVADAEAVPDMYSFVFEFKKNFVPEADASGLANFQPPAAVAENDVITPNERVIARLAKTLDLDNFLNNDIDLLRRYIDETKELLVGCGRSVANYEAEVCAQLQA